MTAIQINVEAGNSSDVAGKSFDLVQFQFHHPSEHSVEGARFAMEAHFVHSAADGGLAMLGVFLIQGAENVTLAPVWAKMPGVPRRRSMGR